MNKKFIYMSLSIFILSLIFILGFKFILGNKVLYEDSMNFDQGKPIIKYIGFEEDDNFYKIKVSIKNTTDYFASIYNLSLQFAGRSQGAPTFSGYDNTEREYILNLKPGDKYNFSGYFGPKEERNYVFEISKGISFDKEVFDTNKMTIRYNAQYYKYKINNNTVIGGAFSSSATEFIDNSIAPYTLE